MFKAVFTEVVIKLMQSGHNDSLYISILTLSSVKATDMPINMTNNNNFIY